MEGLLVLAGLAALFAGGEALVRGAVGLAARLRVPPLVIGLTVVGFGTSAPELVVSIGAALRGVPDIALGNVVGSNIANILLILGLCALLRPLSTGTGDLRRETAVMMAAALALVPLFLLGRLDRGAGALLLAALAAYLGWTIRTARAGGEQLRADTPAGPALLWVGAGLVALVLGARWLVDGAVGLARGLGLSEAFIGLSIVAVGTSLPELATGVVAALRRQADLAIGNVVGSNIFNVLGILGATALVAPIPVAPRFATFDLPVMLAATAAAVLVIRRAPVIGRAAGVAALAAYAAYLWAARGAPA
jgi:cation:H+ antiporter